MADPLGSGSQTFNAEISSKEDGITTVRTEFGVPASNDVIVADAVATMSGLHLDGGRGIRFTGPMSIPVAFAIAHLIGHRYGFVACYDPKLSQFVVVISHAPDMRIGDLID